MTETPRFSSPHAHGPADVTRTMLWVLAAMTPTTLYGFYLFGWPAIFLFTVTVASAAVAEAAALAFAGRPVAPFLRDGSAMVSGWIVALTLPPWAPWWIGVLAGLIAIVLGKQVFGGLGQNIFNPAMVARVMLLISFPVELTAFLSPQPLFSASAPGLVEGFKITFGSGAGYDAVSSASILGHVRTQLHEGAALDAALAGFYDPLAMFIGHVPGSLGETSKLLILLGGLALLWKRIITWHIPVAMTVGLIAVASGMHLWDPNRHAGPLFHLLSGTFLFGAFFIATDYVTAPVSSRGRLIFGAGCGVLTYVIRTWSAYPEGLGFAVLLMNATTPLIDRYVHPRIFGRTRSGDPLRAPDD